MARGAWVLPLTLWYRRAEATYGILIAKVLGVAMSVQESPSLKPGRRPISFLRLLLECVGEVINIDHLGEVLNVQTVQ